MTDALDAVRTAILHWYATAHRAFPWRGTRDPYAVLVSEVMLQQTQAGRIADRFPRFMARFPTTEALAAADPADVLSEWSGLGYNRRALALQRATQVIVRDGWPREVDGLERLPGIGPYTARAVASLAFGTRVGVVDTNVRRWLVRRFGPGNGSSLQTLSDALACRPGGDTASWTHASMEFGAAVCRAAVPLCATCPIASGCPSRDRAERVPIRRQTTYSGSPRAYRGAVLRLLSGAVGHALSVGPLEQALALQSPRIGPPLARTDFDGIVAGLEFDGLLTRRDGLVRLGSPPDRSAGDA